jgi:hypothetical protein
MNYLRDKSCFGDFKVSSCITPGGLTLLLLFVIRLIFRLFCFKIFCDKIFKLMHFLHKLCLYSMYDWWWDGSMDYKDGVKQIYILTWPNSNKISYKQLIVKKEMKTECSWNESFQISCSLFFMHDIAEILLKLALNTNNQSCSIFV